jgi:hypothetical protein
MAAATIPITRSSQVAMLAVSFIFMVGPVALVGLRLLAKRMRRRPWDASDFTILATVVC